MHTIIHGDCLEELKKLEDNSVDAVICDPPYGLSNTKPTQVADVLAAWVTGETEAVPAKRGGFMGKDWDSFVPPPAVWAECMRVLKPGGHMAVFAGARTQDLMGLSIRLAGFEIRDTLGWIYGSGFPKSMDVSKAIDKAAGEEREVIGRYTSPDGRDRSAPSNGVGAVYGRDGREWNKAITAPATSEAQRWDGWGTALKPAIEPIILARKPLDGTVANNVLAHGVGGLNIDACRVGASGGGTHCGNRNADGKCLGHGDAGKSQSGATFHADESAEPAGRFPANVLLDEHAAKEMDKQSGVLKSGARTPTGREPKGHVYGLGHKTRGVNTYAASEGGASRFFPVFKYQAKAPKKERPVIVREDGTKIQHNTVKPLALMEWLVSLIVPPGGVVLDPFAGSGTTLQAALNKGFTPIGIEQDADYIQLINKRMEGGEQSTRNS